MFWFEAAVKARNQIAIAVTKVKAHSTDANVRNALTTAIHRAGNDEADDSAKEAVAKKEFYTLIELASSICPSSKPRPMPCTCGNTAT